MKFKTRRRLALLVLLVGMPVYVIVAVTIVGLFDRLPKALEFVLYVFLGVAWIFPLKPLFLGIARPDPDEAGPAQGATHRETAEPNERAPR